MSQVGSAIAYGGAVYWAYYVMIGVIRGVGSCAFPLLSNNQSVCEVELCCVSDLKMVKQGQKDSQSQTQQSEDAILT